LARPGRCAILRFPATVHAGARTASGHST